jgi:hypothetical protein
MTTFYDLNIVIETLSGDITAPVTEDTITDGAAVESLDITHSTEQIATCQLTLAKAAFVASFDEQNMLSVAAGLSGFNPLFFGDQDGVGFDGQGRAIIRAVGFLGRLDQEWGDGDYEYTAQTSDEIARNYIEKSAIPSALHSVQNSTWDPTVPESIFLRDRDNPLQKLRALVDQELRYVTERSDGAIYIDAIAITSSVQSFDDSDPDVTITRDRVRRGLYNKVIVTGRPDSLGLPLTSEAFTSSPFVLTPRDYWTLDLDFPLIQDQTQADLISARALEIYNVRPERGSVICLLVVNAVQPGTTITLTSSHCDLSGVDVFVESVTYHVTAGTREIRWWRFPA